MKLNTFSSQLLHWFDACGRHDLPWQKQKTAYRVWLSEIMLQQTQVKTVIDYFHRFTKRFPNVKALATADINEVLQLWAGLGYYARARNLHRTAQIIHQDYQGRFPRTVDALQELPGIGRSTAGAIVSIAFGEKATILDGNVKRVLSRILALEGTSADKIFNDTLWDVAESLTPAERVGDYTQAIMDLGATLCTRTKPRCQDCPLKNLCRAYQSDRVLDFPNAKMKKIRPERAVHLILLKDNAQRILLQKRPDKGIWGGLWCLPELKSPDEVVPWCHQHQISEVKLEQRLEPIKHILTHFTLYLHVHCVTCSTNRASIGAWHSSLEIQNMGFPAPIQKLLNKVS